MQLAPDTPMHRSAGCVQVKGRVGVRVLGIVTRWPLAIPGRMASDLAKDQNVLAGKKIIMQNAHANFWAGPALIVPALGDLFVVGLSRFCRRSA